MTLLDVRPRLVFLSIALLAVVSLCVSCGSPPTGGSGQDPAIAAVAEKVLIAKLEYDAAEDMAERDAIVADWIVQLAATQIDLSGITPDGGSRAIAAAMVAKHPGLQAHEELLAKLWQAFKNSR